MPTLIRVDGKAFHTLTRGMERPFDHVLIESMWETAKYLCANVMGCKLAYVQSDEITLLLTDYDTLQTQPWFDKNVVKMISISASMATMAFNRAFQELVNKQREASSNQEYLKILERKIGSATFDSRVFNIPEAEVTNNFIWRQQDATRNAIEMVGQTHFSHRQLHKITCNQIQEMLWQEKRINFNDLPVYLKRGACIVKETYEKEDMPGVMRTRWAVDKDIPVFTADREYIEKHVRISKKEDL